MIRIGVDSPCKNHIGYVSLQASASGFRLSHTCRTASSSISTWLVFHLNICSGVRYVLVSCGARVDESAQWSVKIQITNAIFIAVFTLLFFIITRRA